jgi:hypothetical protein
MPPNMSKVGSARRPGGAHQQIFGGSVSVSRLPSVHPAGDIKAPPVAPFHIPAATTYWRLDPAKIVPAVDGHMVPGMQHPRSLAEGTKKFDPVENAKERKVVFGLEGFQRCSKYMTSRQHPKRYASRSRPGQPHPACIGTGIFTFEYTG